MGSRCVASSTPSNRCKKRGWGRLYPFVSPSTCFINPIPVKREIVAADFRDRVVHHLPYNWIAPIFNRELCEYLIRTVIYHDPLANACFQSPPEAWDDLPSDKSLMGSVFGM